MALKSSVASPSRNCGRPGIRGRTRPAGVAHAWFELIHPFEDGNGRVGRALLDRALAQDEDRSVRLYSLSARFMAVRNEYYDALQSLSRGTLDATDLLRWFLDQIVAACADSAPTVERVLAKARFWMRHGQSRLNVRQHKALNALLDAGPRGFVGGMTNKKYAHLNRVSPATAQRDLAELAARGVLRAQGGVRSVRYELAYPQSWEALRLRISANLFDSLPQSTTQKIPERDTTAVPHSLRNRFDALICSLQKMHSTLDP